jgi:hypothetical protein
MVAPTCLGITLSSSGSVPSAFWEILNWGPVDRILWMGVFCIVTWCVHHVTRHNSSKDFIWAVLPRCNLFLFGAFRIRTHVWRRQFWMKYSLVSLSSLTILSFNAIPSIYLKTRRYVIQDYISQSSSKGRGKLGKVYTFTWESTTQEPRLCS